ncbi:hypothetical protein ACFW1D_28110 [Priestia megaterium]|uniref:hypothetical protein n=1 Tax=Priestia megaterium TaxID=1404 RepID=UPI00366CB06D
MEFVYKWNGNCIRYIFKNLVPSTSAQFLVLVAKPSPSIARLFYGHYGQAPFELRKYRLPAAMALAVTLYLANSSLCVTGSTPSTARLKS